VTHQPTPRQHAAIELLRMAFKFCRAAGVALIPEPDGTRARILCRDALTWRDTDTDHLPTVRPIRQAKCSD
jgi:hypothetical protein